MAEYVDKEQVIEWFRPYGHEDEGIPYYGLVTDIREMKPADVAPVVRCKDCEHAERYERADGTAGYYCGHPKNTFTYGERWDRVFKPAKEADDFCSYGERKETDHE